MQEKKWIVFGAGEAGRKAILHWGAAKVLCFCDNYKSGTSFCGKDVISTEQLCHIWDASKYRVDIANNNIDVACKIKDQLEYLDIPFEHWTPLTVTEEFGVHVTGRYPDIHYIFDENAIHGWRLKRSINMLKDVFEAYSDIYEKMELDFFLFGGDSVYTADRIGMLLKREHILAYSEIYGIDRVVSVPDYNFIKPFIDGHAYYDDAIKILDSYGNMPFEDNRAFWGGNLANAGTRMILKKLGERYPQKLFINDYVFEGNEILYGKRLTPPLDFMRYKYLIDIRGFGWTDRVKYLLGMKRPLLLVDRPYREYYFDQLIPMKHYVPIKEDLSDLIEKIDLLNENAELYHSICNNAFAFVRKNFTKEAVRNILDNRIRKYGGSIDAGK